MASSDEAGPSRKRKHAATDRDSLVSSPKKKVAKVKYHQKFLPSYSKDYPCIIASKVSKEHARCVLCEIDFKVCYGGLEGVARHCPSTRHIERSEAQKKTAKLTSFFDYHQNKSDLSTIHAETLFTHFLVEQLEKHFGGEFYV